MVATWIRRWIVPALMAGLLISLNACREADDEGANSMPGEAASSPDAGGAKAKSKAALARERDAKDAPNLLLITIDTLRADHLGCYGYFRDTSPTMDALSKDSYFFERCIVPMAQTLPSHLSILTGMYPHEHGILCNLGLGGDHFKLSPDLKSIARVLLDQGYSTAGFVSAAPVKKATGINAGFEYWNEATGEDRKELGRKRPAAKTNVPLLAWLAKQSGNQPFMAWVHYFDPHTPYDLSPPYDTMYQTDEALEEYLAGRKFGIKHLVAAGETVSKPKFDRVKRMRDDLNAYDGEIRYLDDQLKVVFQRLKELNFWDNTIIVLTGDHGEGLGQHGDFRHNEIWSEQLHVPLMIRVPGHAPKRISTLVASVDILPTVIALADGALPADEFLDQASGRNVLADDFKSPVAISQLPSNVSRTGYAITTEKWKYIHDPSQGNKLYHVEEDPFELNNIIEAHPDRATSLRDQLTSYVRVQKARGRLYQPVALEMSDAQKEANEEMLRGLGYLDDDEELDHEEVLGVSADENANEVEEKSREDRARGKFRRRKQPRGDKKE